MKIVKTGEKLDNIKIHKKARLYPFSRKYSFGNTTGGEESNWHPPSPPPVF